MEKLVFIVDDEIAILKQHAHWIEKKWNYRVKTFSNGKDALDAISDNPDLVILDIMMPDISGIEVLRQLKQIKPNLPVIMLSAQGDVSVAIESIRLGAFDYYSKVIIEADRQNYDLEREIENLKEALQHEYSFDNIISADKKMQEAFKMVSKVLDNDITVLIEGESGTGKELVARAIHYNGKRKTAPFVVVNCASIPRELLESELFGHEKGAFTGAHVRKIGK
ncbi:MAG: sigma-54-dependent transcriptional regulator, partial [Melioribacteraceae bacterium]